MVSIRPFAQKVSKHNLQIIISALTKTLLHIMPISHAWLKIWVVAVLLDTTSKNMLTQTHVKNENHVKNKWMTIPSSRSMIFEVKSTGSKLAFIRVLRLRKTSEDFGRLRKTLEDFGRLRKTSDVVWSLQTSSEDFGLLQTSSWKWSYRL